LYTQQQVGEEEQVLCWDALTGESIWTFRDKSRFEESVAGAGPRATPTFHEGRIYATGAAGHVHCLDAVTGQLVWTRDLISDGGRQLPEWGFASSPLIVDGLTLVFAGGPNAKSLIAYRAEDGEPVWSAGEGANSYSSAQLVTLSGQLQVLLATDQGLSSFRPDSGQLLWTHDWPSGGVARIVQPHRISETDFILGTGMGVGTRRIRVTNSDDQWQTEEIWTTKRIKPYYNDFVVHDGHIYGFDGPIFMCLDVAEGQLKWRERGYGNGQALLVADQSLLVILSEKGEVALVKADPSSRQELAKFQAIAGKTWNHPVIAHGHLYVRNGEEAACFQLAE
jgi:outer membrane protein assembly factor BamB